MTRGDSTWVRRVARHLLARAVRGRGARRAPWGEAILAEFDQTRGGWEAVRWAAGGVRVALRERRGGRGAGALLPAARAHRLLAAAAVADTLGSAPNGVRIVAAVDRLADPAAYRRASARLCAQVRDGLDRAARWLADRAAGTTTAGRPGGPAPG
ncbi:MAG TPA: hypothetical protein VNV66_16430 [Pilimelia sp.]|nr:hypothetical protein [Pilimelia sp.]